MDQLFSWLKSKDADNITVGAETKGKSKYKGKRLKVTCWNYNSEGHGKTDCPSMSKKKDDSSGQKGDNPKAKATVLGETSAEAEDKACWLAFTDNDVVNLESSVAHSCTPSQEKPYHITLVSNGCSSKWLYPILYDSRALCHMSSDHGSFINY